MSLQVTPNPLAFGSVTAGQSSTLGVTLIALDPSGASIEVIVLEPGSDPAFAVQQTLTVPPAQAMTPAYGDSTNLAQGDTAAFTVKFFPATTGLKTATLRVGYNGPGGTYSVVVPITGTGI